MQVIIKIEKRCGKVKNFTAACKLNFWLFFEMFLGFKVPDGSGDSELQGGIFSSYST
jgi:hypothetical protein